MGLSRTGFRNAGREGLSAKGTLRVVDPAWAAVDWTLSKPCEPPASGSAVWRPSPLGINQNILLTHQVAFAIDMGTPSFTPLPFFPCSGSPMPSAPWKPGLRPDRAGSDHPPRHGHRNLRDDCPDVHSGRFPALDALLLFHLPGSRQRPLFPHDRAAVTDIFQGLRVGPIVGAVWFAFAVGAPSDRGWEGGFSKGPGITSWLSWWRRFCLRWPARPSGWLRRER